ncbi:MAG: hypothetical protein AABW41_03880 [Nanoarchaeota archaeon]
MGRTLFSGLGTKIIIYRTLFSLFAIFLSISFVVAEEDEDKNGLFDGIADFIKNFIFDFVNIPLNETIKNIIFFASMKIDISALKDLWLFIVMTLNSFYVLILSFHGIKLITNNDAISRSKSKNSLRNLIIIIIFVNSSYLIYESLLGFSHSVNSIFSNYISNDISYFEFRIDSLGNLFSYFFLLIASYSSLLAIGTRNFILMLGIVFFPLAGILYSFQNLKPYGAAIIEFLVILMFFPSVYSIIMISASKLASSFGNNQVLLFSIAYSTIFLMSILTLFFVFNKSLINAKH